MCSARTANLCSSELVETGHATSEPAGDGTNRPSETRVLLMPRVSEGPWWASYFDESYLLEFEPLFEETINRAEVTRLMELLELPDGAKVLDCPCRI